MGKFAPFDQGGEQGGDEQDGADQAFLEHGADRIEEAGVAFRPMEMDSMQGRDQPESAGNDDQQEQRDGPAGAQAIGTHEGPLQAAFRPFGCLRHIRHEAPLSFMAAPVGGPCGAHE
ncbi:MAG: hypothetical protein WDN06_11345 [Asticcacaulis sp.]